MSKNSSIDISASGLTAQRTRMDVIANNIANAATTRTASGGPFKRKLVVFKTMDDSSDNENGVKVDNIVEDTKPPKMVYDPGHPDADANGYVAMPNINVVEEMVDMISATRAYEANVTAINSAKSMQVKALEIGKG